jgi:hypothetical protein
LSFLPQLNETLWLVSAGFGLGPIFNQFLH